ncbi:Regulator of G-protein signaling 7-binding protein A, partial [Stegodyphus mimosarum]
MSCGTELAKRRTEQPSIRGGIRAAINRRLSRPGVYDSSEGSKSSELQLADCERIIEELNSLVATFRDLLIHVGKGHDSPEVRDKLKIVRKKCQERCSAANRILMPQIRNDVAEGIPVDSQHLVNLVCCTQLLLREIHKCRLLVMSHPMDMTSYYERRPRSSGVAVLDKLILWRPPLHDYHQEELISIQRDMDSVSAMLNEMLDFMPQE